MWIDKLNGILRQSTHTLTIYACLDSTIYCVLDFTCTAACWFDNNFIREWCENTWYKRKGYPYILTGLHLRFKIIELTLLFMQKLFWNWLFHLNGQTLSECVSYYTYMTVLRLSVNASVPCSMFTCVCKSDFLLMHRVWTFTWLYICGLILLLHYTTVCLLKVYKVLTDLIFRVCLHFHFTLCRAMHTTIKLQMKCGYKCK